ncbi:tail fiber protein [Pectobacterium phage MA14]|nr:tail fiber protein [Pectobacterium phage MA14]
MKVSGSYESVVLGVSQQVAHERRSGQMWEQVNMVSDPVRGLVRRHGSKFRTVCQISDTVPGNIEQLAAQYDVVDYDCDGRELVLAYSKSACAVGMEPVYAYDITNNKLLAIRGQGSLYAAMRANGVAARVNVGRFMYMAPKGTVTTWRVNKRIPDVGESKHGVVWIRQGNFSRTYGLRVKFANGSEQYVSFKTPPASYPTALDTSDITMPVPPQNPDPSQPWDGPNPGQVQEYQKALAEYNKAIMERTQASLSAVTSWIATSTAQIQPEYIAQKLYEALLPFVPDGAWYEGNYLICNTNAGIADVTLADGGDDTYMRSVFDTVESAEKLSPKHWPGKIVRVSAKKQDQKDAYYLEAFAKTSTATNLQDVVWRETAGQQTVPENIFAHCWADMDTFFIGSNPAELNGMSAADAPGYEPSSVGDILSSPAPQFFGKAINYLGVFQDRLLVSAGAVVFASRPGDYLNWFRQTVLSVEDNDPIEMYALGSEDDSIYWDATFDRNLVLFGKKFQYVIPGRQTMSPKSPYIQIMSSIEDAVLAEPKASGSYVFYGKDTSIKGSIHQIQLDAVADSSDSYEVSQALDTYLKGRPCQLTVTQSPNVVAVRTTKNPYGFYVYSYLQDMNGGERVFDSWSQFQYDPALGPLFGLQRDDGKLLAFTFRNIGGALHAAVDEFTFDTELPPTGYVPVDGRLVTRIMLAFGWWIPRDTTLISLAPMASQPGTGKRTQVRLPAVK